MVSGLSVATEMLVGHLIQYRKGLECCPPLDLP